MTTNQEQASLRLAANIVLDLKGEDAEAMAERIERTVYEATFGEGIVTGSTKAEVHEHYFDVVLLTPKAARLDEDEVATWLSRQIEDGHIDLEQIPKLMARYALADQAEMRNELAERMTTPTQGDNAQAPRG